MDPTDPLADWLLTLPTGTIPADRVAQIQVDMNGSKYDERFAFACPHERERPAHTPEAVIGELGLVPHHSFLYHFDYTADHLLEVEVIRIRLNVRPGNYPRLVDSYGKAPPYGMI